MKQRAKEKIDSIKRSIRKTGGGPAPPTLTPGEEAMAKSLEGRPVCSGIPDGIDTDALSCSGCKETEDGSPVVQSNVPEKAEKRKSRRSSCNTEIEELTMKNIKLDNERLQLEILKLKKETEKMSEEMSFIQIRKLYYHLKIQSEYQVSVAEPIPEP